MHTKIWWTLIIGLFVVILALAYLLIAMPVSAPTVEDIVATSTPNANLTLRERVIVRAPLPNQAVSSTFPVTGEAPGGWYFEGSFPIKVLDTANNKIGQGIAQAQSDWMTAEQVPFVAAISVGSYTGKATLVLLRDNPSGLPKNDDSVSMPIFIQ